MDIKWVNNSKVKKNSKILQSSIIEKESDASENDVVVTMANVTKEYPILNIRFPKNSQTRENKIQNSIDGTWITKSWREYNNPIVIIDIREKYISFNKARFTEEEFKDVVDVITKIKETI